MEAPPVGQIITSGIVFDFSMAIRQKICFQFWSQITKKNLLPILLLIWGQITKTKFVGVYLQIYLPSHYTFFVFGLKLQNSILESNYILYDWCQISNQ